ncbi:YrrS family protein [Bacillus sp. MUM 13]|uniref:YrrS family protein n=1 Tax=Bacillus sp. MUM 13 TaxID=1678001 RepID=UPI0009F46A3D|nr:YrrS family protein [Bacillus sp. MUM 13]
MSDFKPIQNNSRLSKVKQKKMNRIYNVLIVVVSLLIIVVGATIFIGNKDQSAAPEKAPSAAKDKNSTTKKESPAKENKDDSSVQASGEETDSAAADDSTDDSGDTKDTADENQKADLKEVQDKSDSNVDKAYESKDWKTVGTTQTGQHTTSFDKGSADWKEMTKALAYGAGIDESNMTTWWLQNGGSPNTAVGTVSAKNDPQTYRVYLQWEDGSGWKPVKIEKLKSNDKK